MRQARRGFSLIEVMLSTSILLGCSIALIELATIGRKQASVAYDLNTAQLLCQAKLNEIVAGIATAKPVEDQELIDQPGWMYSVEIERLRSSPLVAVKVSVFEDDLESRRPIRFTLVRWIPDSATRNEDEPARPAATESTAAESRPGPRREVPR